MGYQPDIYDVPACGVLYSPFDLKLRPMARLLLINFIGDPVYYCIEPQFFDDAIQGRGILVLLYRRDGRVDVYRQPALRIDRDEYEIQKGLNVWAEAPLDGARFEITPNGAEVDLAFDDMTGRHIEARVREDWLKRKPLSLLAPVSAAVANPRQLMLAYVFEFDFVRRPGAEVTVRLGGEKRHPIRMPLFFPGTPAYFIRYSGDPFIVGWNHNRSGILRPLTPRGAGEFKDGDGIYHLAEKNGHLEIEGLSGSNGRHAVAFAFTPALPDLVCLRAGFRGRGEFSIKIDQRHNVAGGDYHVSRTGQEIEVRLELTKGWHPVERDLLLRTIFTFVPLFKRWPKTYRWLAKLERGPEGVTIQAAWQRK